jgi:hypothetical protein
MDARARRPKPKPKPPKLGEPFVGVPLRLAAAAAHAIHSPQAFVYTWLLYLAWKARSPTFPLPNDSLAAYGVDRHAKKRALASLEKAGLVTVNRRARKSPVVTLTEAGAPTRPVAED